MNMKIAFNRSSPKFWLLYLSVYISFLLILLFLVRWIWSLITKQVYVFDLPEMAFEACVFSISITIVRFIRYYIGKKRYEKNPVDRRKNNLFRE